MKKLFLSLATLACAFTIQAGEFPDISISELDKAIAEKRPP